MSNWHGGKGSARRSKKDDKYLENWEKIFGKKKISILDLKNVIEIKNKSKKHGTK
tara:strand:+ start:192 stop:356 length:165 start_codon:yes stop_codon:yes gene_type:complete